MLGLRPTDLVHRPARPGEAALSGSSLAGGIWRRRCFRRSRARRGRAPAHTRLAGKCGERRRADRGADSRCRRSTSSTPDGASLRATGDGVHEAHRLQRQCCSCAPGEQPRLSRSQRERPTSTCSSSGCFTATKIRAGRAFRSGKSRRSVDGRHAAGPQEIFRGSFAQLETPAPLIEEADFEIDLWIWPTLPATARKAFSPGARPNARTGFALRWTRRVGSSRRAATREIMRSREPLAPRAWARIRLAGASARLSSSRSSPRDYSPRYEAGGSWRDGCLAARRCSDGDLTIAAADVELDRKPACGLSRSSTARLRGSRFRSAGETRCAFDFRDRAAAGAT